MELAKVFVWRSVEQFFPTTRVLGHQNQKSRAKPRRFPRPTAYIQKRSLEGGFHFISRLVRFAVYYGNASRTREMQQDVKRRLLRSIFARCTFLNAKRARGNSWDFIALSFLHGLRIFMRLCKLPRVGIFKGTFLLVKYDNIILRARTECTFGTIQSQMQINFGGSSCFSNSSSYQPWN